MRNPGSKLFEVDGDELTVKPSKKNRRQTPPILFGMTGACGVTGGVATANLTILRALTDLADANGRELLVLSFLEKETDRPLFLPSWVVFQGYAGSKVRFALRLLRSAVNRPLCCFDHVYLALPILPLAATGFLRSVIFAHGSEAWKRIRPTSSWSFRSAALCLTNSGFTLEKMRQRIGTFRGEACPLGLSPEFRLNPRPNSTPRECLEMEAVDGETRVLGPRVLLLVSRMDPREGAKGHRLLIEILPRLREEYPQVQLVFPGPGESCREYVRLARRLGVSDSVFLPGWVPIETLRQLYSHCYAFVMPSLQEGFGLAYLEAMNYAKPCVGCSDQGAEEVIVDGETGYLIRDPRQGTALLAVLRRLLDDPERASKLGLNGFRRLHERFTSERYEQRIKDKISRVL